VISIVTLISLNTHTGNLILNTVRKYAVTSETVNEYTQRVKLAIYNLQPEDSTDYNCSARNTLGENSGIVRLSKDLDFFNFDRLSQ